MSQAAVKKRLTHSKNKTQTQSRALKKWFLANLFNLLPLFFCLALLLWLFFRTFHIFSFFSLVVSLLVGYWSHRCDLHSRETFNKRVSETLGNIERKTWCLLGPFGMSCVVWLAGFSLSVGWNWNWKEWKKSIAEQHKKCYKVKERNDGREEITIIPQNKVKKLWWIKSNRKKISSSFVGGSQMFTQQPATGDDVKKGYKLNLFQTCSSISIFHGQNGKTYIYGDQHHPSATYKSRIVFSSYVAIWNLKKK